MRQSHSYSKRDLLESCARRYFYEYYAAAKKAPFDPGRKEIVRTLKELSGSYLFAGDLLHWFIEQYLKKGPTPSLRAWLMRKVEERFDKSVDWSRRYSPFDEVEKEQYPTPRLMEFYYDDPRAEDLATAARKKLILAISNFLDNREISALWRSIINGEHWVEKRLSKLPKVDGFGIEGKIDLLGRADNCVNIVDWKLGQAGGGHDSLQLHLYGLWAGKEFQVDPGRVSVQRVFLGDATVEQAVPLDRSSLRIGKARLIQDIELMKELEPYGSSGNEEAFSPCVKENVCRQCKYQQVCPDSQSGLLPRPTFVSLPLIPCNQ